MAAALAGLGVGVGLRAGVSSAIAATPPNRRAEVASGLFVAVYLGASLPTIAAGPVAILIDLRTAVITLAAAVTARNALAIYLIHHSDRTRTSPS